MRYHLSFLFVLLATLAMAQPLQPVFNQSFEPSFFDYFRSSGQKNFYLSPDASQIMVNSDLGYTLLSGSDGQVIAQGEHVEKVNALSASMLGILRNRSLNRSDAIENVRFDEGTEYLIFEEEGVVVFLDWNVSQNIVKAVSLKDGQELWRTEKYRFSSSSKEQYVDLALSMAFNMRLNRTQPRDIAAKNVRLQGYGEGVQTSNYASDIALGFLTPLPGFQSFMLLLTDGTYVTLDLLTGAEKWTYQDPLNIGFSEISEAGDLIIVNFNSSYLQKNERLILKLNPETGEEIWRTSHLANFRQGRTHLSGNRLICDYYGAEVFDLTTGERVFLTVDEKVIKTQNRMTVVFNSGGEGGRGTEAIASPSVILGDRLYGSVFKQGKRAFANDGSGKAIVQAFDLASGRLLWESDKLKAGTDLSFASEDQVFVRQGKAFGKSALMVLEAKSGRLLGETETIDGFIYREGAGDILTDDYLYRGGKKSVYAFDQDNLKLEHEFDTRKLSVGKLDVMLPAGEQLMTIGTKGMAFFSGESGQKNAVETSRVYGSYWNDRHAFLFLQKKTLAIDLASQSEQGEGLLL
ncbi:MAG: PQQ-binding-like beta-propeller repeat protein [Bacteroidota bacterium]